MRCDVEGITHRGEGVGRIDGQAVFIPYAMPGETVEIDIVERKKSFLRAKLNDVINASPDRVQPPCPYYYRCGGCSLQHVAYPRQLELKRQIVQDNLDRIGGLKAAVEKVFGMTNPWRYRNKVEWQVVKKGLVYDMGYYLPKSHQLLPVDGCLLISQEMEALGRYMRERLEEVNAPRQFQLTVRQSSDKRQLMLICRGGGTAQMEFTSLLDYPQLISIYCLDQGRVIHKHGSRGLSEKLAGIEHEISPLAFFQVNHQQAELMIEIVKDFARLGPSDQVLEGYCGIGSITLPLARQVGKITGVESYSQAVEDARENARRNRVANCEFIAGACEQMLPNVEERFDVVVLDPPRAGCPREVIDAVIQAAPNRIVYVSCNPGTLARDLKIFGQNKYVVTRVQPIDMFPQTHHVETVVLMSRNK